MGSLEREYRKKMRPKGKVTLQKCWKCDSDVRVNRQFYLEHKVKWNQGRGSVTVDCGICSGMNTNSSSGLFFFANICPKPKTDLRVLRFRETVEFREHFLILRKENLISFEKFAIFACKFRNLEFWCGIYSTLAKYLD